MSGVNHELLRKMNRCKILNTIRLEGMISRAQIAKKNNLSQAAVTGITTDLIREKLIFEKKTGISPASGRKPILLALNPGAPPVIGVKLAKDLITVALTNINTEVINFVQVDVPKKVKTAEQVADLIFETIGSCLKKAGIQSESVAGVGIGMAGMIDTLKGVCLFSPFFGWQNISFKKLLEKRLHIPVYIENNVKTLTMAEKWFGSGKGIDNFLLITIGKGVGMSMVFNGEIFRGSRGYGGEFGHITIDPKGRQCDCGKKGCLETFIADKYLLAQAVKILKQTEKWSDDRLNKLDIETVTEMSLNGLKKLVPVFKTAGDYLGRGIATLINILEPEQIIITGEGVRASDLLFEPMKKAIKKHTFNNMGDNIKIIVERRLEIDWARGAASLALQKIFSMPV
jgi:predicted NBD/HSP70 family sugar kinase